jgi:hypothetical protein
LGELTGSPTDLLGDAPKRGELRWKLNHEVNNMIFVPGLIFYAILGFHAKIMIL